MAQVPKPPGHILLIHMMNDSHLLRKVRHLLFAETLYILFVPSILHVSGFQWEVLMVKKKLKMFFSLCVYMCTKCVHVQICVWGGGRGEPAEILIRMHVAQLKS